MRDAARVDHADHGDPDDPGSNRVPEIFQRHRQPLQLQAFVSIYFHHTI